MDEFYKIVQAVDTNFNEIETQIKSHILNLSYPMDSWLEDRLLECNLIKFTYGNACIGYCGIIKDTIHFFYIEKAYFKYAPKLFEKIIDEKSIERVLIMTQDPLLMALIAEWDYDKDKQACWFTDSKMRVKSDLQYKHGIFRQAIEADIQQIREVTGEFFNEVSGGFNTIEERVEAGNIFVLKEHESLLGCGIIEKSQFNLKKNNQPLIIRNNKEDIVHAQVDELGKLALGYELTGHEEGRDRHTTVSIGMFVNPKHRKKGVAKEILINLKKWAYENDYIPVAGCWYYNTLSRKSLEAAGMIATSIGYEAILKGKEKLPLRTGNPPGELIEEC